MSEPRSEHAAGDGEDAAPPAGPAIPPSDALFTVLDSSASSVVAVTASGTINYVNHSGLDAFGYTLDELLGQPVEVLIPAPHARHHAGLREGYVADARPRAMGSGLELAARRKDGTTFPVEISLTPVPTPEGTWTIAGVVDISARRAAEERVGTMSRAHLALAELNAEILRARTPEDLYTHVCRVIAAASPRVATWVATPDDADGLRVASRVGDIGPIGKGGLDPLHAIPPLLSVLADSFPWFCADIGAEVSGPWADWAGREGITAAVALPVRRISGVAAVLVVQAPNRTLLEEDLVSVLITMAENVSFALDRLDSQAQLQLIDAQRVDLLNRLVAAQEDERARIAADVHDHSIQSLAAIDLRLGLLRTRIAAAAPELTDSVDALQVALSDVTGGLRHLLFELEVPDPGVTLTDQVRDALAYVFLDDSVATSIRVENGANPALGATQADADLPPVTRGHAIRICKEALTNVRRHAQASHVVIAIRPDPDGVEIAVIDDGVGPSGDVATLRSAQGHRGLDGMRDRAQVVGGWCRLERDEGLTTLRYWLPRGTDPSPAG
ncbi:PAS domain S-box protein [Nocardioides caricicola]|uniref:histidine kinase n=1 Tax=Nocardioides caricicola TaxID=634770 RepID=A0ABW0N320_9ACTN